jgi:hypothetical protein
MSEALNVPSEIAVLSPRSNRPTHTYDVPPRGWAIVGIKSIGLVRLTADEEIAVLQKARSSAKLGDAVRVQYELAKAAIVSIDGQALRQHTEALEVAWNALTPPARTLLLRAYQDLHAVDEDITADFLKGKTTTVG